ncbi:MAG: aldolase/citrate lyase family protein [Propionibacteriaceae bacterium]
MSTGRPGPQGPAGAAQLAAELNDELDRKLASADALWLARYPGDPSSRQPVHTVYVPADRFSAGTPQEWGAQAQDLLQTYAPDPDRLAGLTGLSVAAVGEVYDRVRAKLEREPIEDLRVDFEDGFGHRGDAVEDEGVATALDALATLAEQHRRPPFFGIRFKSFEAPTRHRGVRTLTGFVAGSVADGALPDGFVVTLPKVTSVDQVQAMVHVCEQLETQFGLDFGALRFEIQIETAQAILAADGTATVAAMVHAAQGRCFGLHYGTFDYSAGLGITAAYQSLEHPAADHAKAVMQVAAAQTGARLSDGSTNVVAFADADQVRDTWTLHTRLVTRSLQRGYYQGWDMHPGHLPTRYLATYAFFRAAMGPAAARLKRYVDTLSGGSDTGGVLDEPATARALATALLRGLRCGAVDADEVLAASDLDEAALVALTDSSPSRPTPPEGNHP